MVGLAAIVLLLFICAPRRATFAALFISAVAFLTLTATLKRLLRFVK